jgi:hypothetical protein
MFSRPENGEIMSIKKWLLALVVSANFMTVAYAGNEPSSMEQPNVTFTTADVQKVFEQNDQKSFQVAALSQQEMKETEGAWFWMVYYYAPALTTIAYNAYNTSAYMPVYHYTTFISNWWSSW